MSTADADETGLPPITVEPTAESVAVGIEATAAAHRTDRPVRSHPAYRRRPPDLEIGSAHGVPARVREQRPDTGLTLRLPKSLRYCFVAAPLAYYLGSEIRLAKTGPPFLTADDAAVDLTFRTLPAFQRDCADLLERVFFLDCLVRNVGRPPTHETSRLAEAVPDLVDDAVALREVPMASRLARYLQVPSTALDEYAPEWHLSSYVAPVADNVDCLSGLLDAMSLVFLPRATRCEGPDLLDRSLGSAFRGRTDHPTRLEPCRRRGQVQAWLAPGAPVGPFKATSDGFRNGVRSRSADDDRTRVRIVRNDREMAPEAADAASAVRKRLAGPVSVTVDRDLSRDALATIFREPADLVHFVGHCDDEGLRCPDGWLDAATLESVGTRAFVLNACGSYDQGLELVREGGVAGVVTLRNVLDDQAATVGGTLVRLLARGFDVARAVDLARRRVLMGADYVAVGDATDVPFPSQEPLVYSLAAAEDGYRLQATGVRTDRTGHRFNPPFAEGRPLNGNTVDRRLDRDETVRVLGRKSMPVIYEDRFCWSDRLASRL